MSSVKEITYSVGAVSRLTGISPDLLRAWERRYGVVTPLRTPGGTRRYRPSDLERLRLLKGAVDAGHRISEVSQLDDEALEERRANPPERVTEPIEQAIDALTRLDAVEAENLISWQLAALGPQRFARRFALPLLRQIGDSWQSGGLCIASEHLGSSILRSLLGSALRPASVSRMAPSVIFATPPGEQHELGLMIAALTAMGAGTNAIYLGPSLPVEEIVRAADVTRASAVAIGLSGLYTSDNLRDVGQLRAGLPDHVELWIGGQGASAFESHAGIEALSDLDRLERRIEHLLLDAHNGLG